LGGGGDRGGRGQCDVGFGWDAGGTGNPVLDTGGQNFGSIGATVYPGVSCINSGPNDQATFNFGATAYSNTTQAAVLSAAGILPLTSA